MRIDGGHSGRYIPITEKARKMAFANSPTFLQWQNTIEDPYIIKLSEQYTGISHSLDTQRYLGLLKALGQKNLTKPGLFDSDILPSVIKNGIITHEATLNKIASEINLAISAGKIPSRFVLSPMIDPVIGEWLKYVPASFWKICKLLYFSPTSRVEMQGYGISKLESARETRILNRNSKLISTTPLTGQIMINASENIASVSLYNDPIVLQVFSTAIKPVFLAVASNLIKIESNHYTFKFPVLQERWDTNSLILRITLSNGHYIDISPLNVGEEWQTFDKYSGLGLK